MELNRLTPPPPAIAMSGSASAASRSDFMGFRCMRASVPTTSRWLSSSVPMSISRSLRSGSSQLRPWIGVLHRRGQFAVGAAELLQQHVAEARVGLVDADGVHQLLDVVIHGGPRTARGNITSERWEVWFVPLRPRAASRIRNLRRQLQLN